MDFLKIYFFKDANVQGKAFYRYMISKLRAEGINEIPSIWNKNLWYTEELLGAYVLFLVP